jgi:hypothetical protein
MSGDHNMHCSANQPVTWTARELELLDGMIEVQLKHADRCDNIRNSEMAAKQKQWDMDRVELLQKVRGMSQREWVGLTDEQIDDVYYCVEGGETALETWREQARAVEAMLKEKNT